MRGILQSMAWDGSPERSRPRHKPNRAEKSSRPKLLYKLYLWKERNKGKKKIALPISLPTVHRKSPRKRDACSWQPLDLQIGSPEADLSGKLSF